MVCALDKRSLWLLSAPRRHMTTADKSGMSSSIRNAYLAHCSRKRSEVQEVCVQIIEPTGGGRCNRRELGDRMRGLLKADVAPLPSLRFDTVIAVSRFRRGRPRAATRPNSLCPSMCPQRVAHGLISVKERATINRLDMPDLEADQKSGAILLSDWRVVGTRLHGLHSFD